MERSYGQNDVFSIILVFMSNCLFKRNVGCSWCWLSYSFLWGEQSSCFRVVASAQ